jgi:hypothetical protein
VSTPPKPESNSTFIIFTHNHHGGEKTTEYAVGIFNNSFRFTFFL